MSGAFNPNKAATVNIDVSSSSQSVKVYNEAGPIDIRIMNNGSATVWVAIGNSSVTASLTTSFPVGPGVTEVLTGVTHTGDQLYVAAIAAGSTGKIYFTPGRGI